MARGRTKKGVDSMPGTIPLLQLLLIRELRTFEREVEMFPDDDRVWATVPGVTNSTGNLVLHVCGNLQHYVGRVLGNTDYVRDRDGEFSRRSGSRAELLSEIKKTIQVIEAVLPTMTDETLAGTYPEPLGGGRVPTGAFLWHLSTHLAYHLGQAGYLRRIVTSDNRSAGGVPVKGLLAGA
jgi:uncharacterized damage-inducible protein DinB